MLESDVNPSPPKEVAVSVSDALSKLPISRSITHSRAVPWTSLMISSELVCPGWTSTRDPQSCLHETLSLLSS